MEKAAERLLDHALNLVIATHRAKNQKAWRPGRAGIADPLIAKLFGNSGAVELRVRFW